MAKCTITNHRPTIIHLPDTKATRGPVLMPGATMDLSDANYLEELRKNANVQNLVNAGYLSVEGMQAQDTGADQVARISNDSGSPLGMGDQNVADLSGNYAGQGAAGQAEDISGFTVSEIEDMVATEDNVSTLKTWLTTEQRKGARTAIETRLAELKG
jgi:hypothetical protein